MSRKTRAEERIEALDTSPEALAAAQVEAVRIERDEAVARVEAERDGYLAALQRVHQSLARDQAISKL